MEVIMYLTAMHSLALLLSGCLISGTGRDADSRAKNFAAITGGVAVSVRPSQAAEDCLVEDNDVSKKIKYIDMDGDEAYLREDLRDCHFIATMISADGKRTHIYCTMHDIIAFVAPYFCNNRAATRVDNLCPEARTAIGNFAYIVKASSRKQKGKADSEYENYLREVELKMHKDFYTPQLIVVGKIPDPSTLKERYRNQARPGFPADLPAVRAYMTFIYSYLHSQLGRAADDYRIEIANDSWMQQNKIYSSELKLNEYTASRFDSLFLFGAHALLDDTVDVRVETRIRYLQRCFGLVKNFMHELGLNIKKKYPVLPPSGSVYGSAQYVERGSVKAEKLAEYERYGYSDAYHRGQKQFQINVANLIVPLADAQAELENTSAVIVKNEGMTAANKTQVAEKIRTYLAEIKKPRRIVMEYRRLEGQPIFKSTAEQIAFFIQDERRQLENFRQQEQDSR